MDAEGAEYIAQVRWQYAKTMPDWPHEYTVKAWHPARSEKFENLARLITRHGSVEPWPPPPAPAIYHNHYLVIGHHKYWAMGPHGDLDLPEEATVINRTSLALQQSELVGRDRACGSSHGFT